MGNMWKSPTALAAILLMAVGAHAQAKLESGIYVLRGQVFSPMLPFDGRFEVALLYDSCQPLNSVTVARQEPFTFRSLRAGTYYVVADIPGFKKVHQRVDINGTGREALANIILDEQRQPIEDNEPVDLSGEEEGVVDASDLAKRLPDLVDELRSADEEIRSGNYDKARQRLEVVVREVPDLYEARKALGTAYQKAGLYRDAEDEFKTARDLRPSSAAPLIGLGSVYLQEAQVSERQDPAAVRGILNDALGSLLLALERNPRAAFGYYLLGLVYHESSLYEDAEDNLLRSLDLEPRLSVARLALANVYIRIEDWPRALSQIDAYLSETPDSSAHTQVRALRVRIEEVLRKEDFSKAAATSSLH